jgi:phosphoribosylaminoimidazolecarboxamide formyltransferase/IMP cyclohydrolase
VIVDLYPSKKLLRQPLMKKAIIEKIDIGGPSMIRGAEKIIRMLWL